uniref:Uncharacterized protein n=1 Tax=Myripristis murdjan TaxID=586833 RepID=A0A668A6L2_9TELE
CPPPLHSSLLMRPCLTTTLCPMFPSLSHFPMCFFSLPLLPSLFQTAALKEGVVDPNRTPGQRPQPQGCLNTVLPCNTNPAAVGPKQV